MAAPRPAVLEALAATLHLSYDDLVGSDGPRPASQQDPALVRILAKRPTPDVYAELESYLDYIRSRRPRRRRKP